MKGQTGLIPPASSSSELENLAASHQDGDTDCHVSQAQADRHRQPWRLETIMGQLRLSPLPHSQQVRVAASLASLGNKLLELLSNFYILTQVRLISEEQRLLGITSQANYYLLCVLHGVYNTFTF